uniref:Uncharacterized protein n=1 Tax=Oryza punctata TaxID=4537 RepID=A0A0E0JQU6_ORYPU
MEENKEIPVDGRPYILSATAASSPQLTRAVSLRWRSMAAGDAVAAPAPAILGIQKFDHLAVSSIIHNCKICYHRGRCQLPWTYGWCLFEQRNHLIGEFLTSPSKRSTMAGAAM